MSAGHPLFSGPVQSHAAVGGAAAVLACLLACPVFAQDRTGPTLPPKPDGPPREPTEAELVRLPRDHEYFQYVEDDGPFIARGRPHSDPKLGHAAAMELKAYDYVLAFARTQPAERLRAHATQNVPLDILFRPIRQDYLRELLHYEGRLALVLEMKPTEGLRELEGVERLYEAWITPRGTDKFVVLVVSELPPGIQPGDRQTANVAFDGYFFKLFHYETREPKDRAEPDRKVWRKAPMFLGRTFEVRPSDPQLGTYSPVMLAGVVAGLTVVVVVAVLMGLWFRRGDRRIQAGARDRLHQNVSFDNIPGPPAPARTDL